jgi:hypothetical protein
MAFQSGKGGQVRVGASPTVVKCKKWEVEDVVQKLEVTNAESGGKGEYIGGIEDGNVTLELDYDLGASTPMLTTWTPGAVIATVKLYIGTTAGAFWLFTSFYVESFTVTSEVRGVVTCAVKGSATGGLTQPVT